MELMGTFDVAQALDGEFAVDNGHRDLAGLGRDRAVH